MSFSPEVIGAIGVVVMLALMFFRMWLGFAMGVVAFIGLWYLTSLNTAMAVLGMEPFSRIGDFNLATIPMFILMGYIISNSGISEDLFRAANACVGQLKGGLAIATIFACAFFAAITGTSLAGVVTMGKIALPEMRKFRYSDSFSSAVVAIGGSLGTLIPPSIGFILYAILTELSISKLFMAGFGPGILLTFLFIVVIKIVTMVKPDIAPAGAKTSFKEKIVSLRYCWAMVAIFIFIIGGIYIGIFTPTEAGALGTFGALVVSIVNRQMSWKIFMDTVIEAVKTMGMLIGIVIGAFIFMRFMTISGLPAMISEFVGGLEVNRYIILISIILMYIVLGMFTDIIASLVITIPVIYPIILSLGFDPIWFGVVVVIIMEVGMITPPIGINIFILSGVTKVPVGVVFRGIWPFVLAQIAGITLITIFPQIALLLPNSM